MSSGRSDPESRALDLERDLPTTAADVAALRRLRGQLPPGFPHAPVIREADLTRLLARRPTSEGWEPFEL
jgi:hypothetical protein